MKFIHISDVYLGASPDADRAWGRERKTELLDTFDRLVDLAREREVDLLLISGNLYDTPPDTAELDRLDAKLSELPITRTIIVAGNHDYITEDSAADLYEFSSNTVVMPGDSFSNAYMEDLNVCITGFSYGKPGYGEDMVSDITPQMEEAVNILLACGGTSETMPFDLKKIAGAGFDYCGLGGIRKPRHIVKNKMAYPGALEPMGCMDTGRRGFIYGEIENGTVRIKWEPFNYRSYVNLGFEVKEGYSAEKIESILTGQMEKMGSQNIYRILLSGEMGKGVKPDFSALKRAYNIYEILDQTYCGFNKDKLYLDNRSNLLGSFIESFDDKNDEISRKALEYGISAIWATGER